MIRIFIKIIYIYINIIIYIYSYILILYIYDGPTRSTSAQGEDGNLQLYFYTEQIPPFFKAIDFFLSPVMPTFTFLFAVP